jgi:hypothetical protein
MAYGRDERDRLETTAARLDDRSYSPTARSDDEFDRRARYLAKAASLGQMVSEDEPLELEH